MAATEDRFDDNKKYELQCPVDHVKINENKARLIALVVLVVGISFLLSGFFPLLILLVCDFLLRVTAFSWLSPAAFLADIIIKIFGISEKPVDRAPKRFAAFMGLVFVIAITGFALFSWNVLVLIFSVALCFFAFLESFLAICVGCYVYSFLQIITSKQTTVK